MLFCFGLFALLLYYTVVANAECSYTYNNSSQHIEAESLQYERQGYQRCEFIIRTTGHHSIELNFTRLTGFGASGAPGDEVQAGSRAADGGDEDIRNKEKEEEKEAEVGRVGGRRGGGGRGEGGGGEGSRGDLRGAEDAEHESEEGRNPPRGSGATAKRRESEDLVLPTAGPSARPPPLLSSTVLARPVTEAVRPTSAAHTSRESAASDVQPGLSHSSPSSSSPLPPAARHGGRSHCSSSAPKVEIRVVSAEGQESLNHVICQERHKYRTPVVFHLHYASSVRIVYVWERTRSSGFTLHFDFDTEDCPFTCDGHLCLRTEKLCDKHLDCQDQADESQSLCRKPAPSNADLDSRVESLVTVIAVVTCLVVLVLLTLVCIVGRHHCSPTACAMHRDAGPSSGHLACPQSNSSEGFTPSAESLQDCSEQAVALLPNGPSRRTWTPPHPPPPPPDLEIGLPPNIPVSPDGEEGYTASQMRLLDPRYRTVQSELFKPPPNKTVFDRESPPPYSLSPSSGSFGCGSAPSRLSPVFTGSTYGHGPMRLVRDCEGQPVVSRCHSMFTPSVRNGAGSNDRNSNAIGGKTSSPDSSDVSPQHRSYRYAHQQRHHHHHPGYQQQQQQQQRSFGAFGTVNTVQCAPPCPPAQYVNSSLSSASAVQTCDTLCWNLPMQQHLHAGRVTRVTVPGVGMGRSSSCGKKGTNGSEGGTPGRASSRECVGSPPDYALAFDDFGSVDGSLHFPDSSGV